MRWSLALLVLVAGCTSAWERHQSALDQDADQGKWKKAAAEAQWLIDNARAEAPANERGPKSEAYLYLRLAEADAQAGNARAAIEALRTALTTDPQQADTVRAQLDHLPLPRRELARVKEEFSWNIAALLPDEAQPEEAAEEECWSYGAREIRIRREWTERTARGIEHQVTYDARPWRFDAVGGRWSPEGDWVTDAGTETELADGPEQPRYRAIMSAAHQFYTDGAVPPCQRSGWQGPFDPNGTVFVAAHLPSP